MRKNIDLTNERGGRIENLDEDVRTLGHTAKIFHGNAREKRRYFFKKNLKWGICIVVTLVVVVVVIVALSRILVLSTPSNSESDSVPVHFKNRN